MWHRGDTDLLPRAGLAPVRCTFLLGHKREHAGVLAGETDVVLHVCFLPGGGVQVGEDEVETGTSRLTGSWVWLEVGGGRLLGL